MAITFSPVLTASANGQPAFSGSIKQGKNIQKSAVIFGSRAGSASFEGIEVGTGQVVVPPGNALCGSAKTAMLAATPTAITLNYAGSTLADAVPTSISASVSQGEEVKISLSYEGGVATITAPSGTAPTAYEPKTSADCSISVDAGADTKCVTSMSVNLTTSYSRVACIGEATASKGFAGMTEGTGSVTYFAPGGIGSIVDGADVVMDFGGFSVTLNNVITNVTSSVDSPTGATITVEMTARSPDGTLDAAIA